MAWIRVDILDLGKNMGFGFHTNCRKVTVSSHIINGGGGTVANTVHLGSGFDSRPLLHNSKVPLCTPKNCTFG